MSTPGVITGIKVTNMRVDRNFLITWDASPTIDSVTQYNIYRAETSYAGFSSVGIVATPTVLQFIDTTIPFSFDKAWYYKVTATNAEGECPAAATPSVTDFDYLIFNNAPVDLDYQVSLVDWVENETPSGTINGSNNIFYTVFNYKPRTLQIFINGDKLLASEFTQNTPNSFVLSITPTIANSLSVGYIKF